MGSIHIRIAHHNHFVISDLLDIEIFRPDSRAQRRNEGLNLLRTEHFVETRLLYIEDLTTQRQNGLRAPIAPLLSRATGRIALNQEDLRLSGITCGAIGEL